MTICIFDIIYTHPYLMIFMYIDDNTHTYVYIYRYRETCIHKNKLTQWKGLVTWVTGFLVPRSRMGRHGMGLIVVDSSKHCQTVPGFAISSLTFFSKLSTTCPALCFIGHDIYQSNVMNSVWKPIYHHGNYVSCPETCRNLIPDHRISLHNTS